MRIFPQKKSARSKRVLRNFKGLDRRYGAPESSFPVMTNMTGEDSCIAVRRKRGYIDLEADNIYSIISTDVLIDGVIRENALIADTGDRLCAFYREDGAYTRKVIMNTNSFTQGRNKIIASGGYLYFFPDKKYINLMNTREKGSLEASVDLNVGTTETATGTYFYETTFTSTDESGKSAMENSGYIRIRSEKCKNASGQKGDHVNYHNFAVHFEKGESIHIENAGEIDGVYKIAYIPDDLSYIVVRGYLTASSITAASAVTLSRRVPDMDYVVASGNRLWGCRYGVDEDGEPVNEIYASALGNAKNWYSFDGVSTDSYAASVGKDGVFTGAVVYEGDPLFFKEDAVIRVYGSAPSDFTILTSNIRGIEKGSSESAVIVNDTLYYMTHSGVVAYNGGMPYNVDLQLGEENYSEAVAGEIDGRYYLSVKRPDADYDLLVYDTNTHLWHREERTRVRGFCRCGSELYMLAGDEGTSNIMTVNGTNTGDEEDMIFWELETGDLAADITYRKYASRLDMRLEKYDPFDNVEIRAEISYNDGRLWERVYESNSAPEMISVPIIPRRCYSYRLRLYGYGRCIIRTIAVSEHTCGDHFKEEI